MKQIHNLTDTEFKASAIRWLTQLRKRIDEHGENFSKELVSGKKDQS